MTIEEILAGESKNVEFKENLPEKSIKYMKSVVAFANGTGGKIIFGIADKTREVVGFDKEDVFKKMDAIANAVSDSCEPAIIPDISLQTIDGKTVIVAEISEGRQRPYYIKALGREGGVYVRVAGTTRLADEYMVRELMFEGSNRYFDQALCSGLTITDEEVDALCKAMKEQAVKNAHTEGQKVSIKDVGRQQLRSWGILIERDGKDYPSNAYAILTGHGGLHVATQCGVFKGTTKAVFVDRREYTGPLWEQIEEAFQFVLRNIHLGATIVGIYRQDIYIYRGQVTTKAPNGINDADKMPDSAGKEPDSVDEAPDTTDKMPDNADKMPDNGQEHQIYKYVLENGFITTAKAVELLGVKHRRARAVLLNMVESDWLKKEGAARSTIYVRNTEER